MIIRDILETSEQFPTLATDDTCQYAAQTMRENSVRAIAVVEGGRLIGIVTDWDIVDAFAQSADDLADMPVSSIMTSDDLVTIDESASVVDATSKIAQHRVHHLPVISDDSYVGMICLGMEWNEEGMLTPPTRPTLTARRP